MASLRLLRPAIPARWVAKAQAGLEGGSGRRFSVPSTKYPANSLLCFSATRERARWLNALQCLSTTGELGNDGFHRSRPDKGLRILVPGRQELRNGFLQVGHVAEECGRRRALPA